MSTTSSQTTWAAIERGGDGPDPPFDPSTLADLPEPARRFLAAAIPAGAPLHSGVALTMRGRIKLGRWMRFTARQILRAGVGFVWEPIVGGRIVRFVGADSLGPGGARMEFALHGVVPVVRASGPDVDRSAAGRLAAETVVWLPQALTPQAGATWRPVSPDRAAVALDGPSGPNEVEVTVDGRGRLTELRLDRWRDSTTPPGPAPFGGSVGSSRDVEGVWLAASGVVGWDWRTPAEDDGRFFEYELTSARFLAGAPGGGSQRHTHSA